MGTLVIDKKEYVVLPKREYEALQYRAASKTAPARKLSLQQGKKTGLSIDR